MFQDGYIDIENQITFTMFIFVTVTYQKILILIKFYQIFYSGNRA